MTGEPRQRIIVPRRVLLIEIERRCHVSACQARTRLGLTKEEARDYVGFTCERCETWNRDTLTERDIPDWWEELRVLDLRSLRAVVNPAATATDPNETIRRLSEMSRARREEPATREDES